MAFNVEDRCKGGTVQQARPHGQQAASDEEEEEEAQGEELHHGRRLLSTVQFVKLIQGFFKADKMGCWEWWSFKQYQTYRTKIRMCYHP